MSLSKEIQQICLHYNIIYYTLCWPSATLCSRNQHLTATIVLWEQYQIFHKKFLIHSYCIFIIQTENFLKHKIRSRPDRAVLVRMHILQGTHLIEHLWFLALKSIVRVFCFTSWMLNLSRSCSTVWSDVVYVFQKPTQSLLCKPLRWN